MSLSDVDLTSPCAALVFYGHNTTSEVKQIFSVFINNERSKGSFLTPAAVSGPGYLLIILLVCVIRTNEKDIVVTLSNIFLGLVVC